MAGPMQATSDPVAISNPLPASSSSILSAPADQISLLKPSSSTKPDAHLSSIASAGLRTSPSPGLEPSRSPSAVGMASPAVNTAADRPSELGKESEEFQHKGGPQVAREALGVALGDTSDREARSSEQTNAASTLNEPTSNTFVRETHVPSDDMQVDSHASPGHAPGTSVHTGDQGANSVSLMNSSTVASPGPIEDTASQDGDRPRPYNEHTDIADDANKAFSYPMPAAGFNDPRRGLSLPHSGFHKGSPRSPSTKKHRCPYCATEFTRHHNLKSHLLTHSQEKPYACQTCQSRFRRLHDLKRHTKLHTGERPHICDKCGRRFARGDALARHNKGQGGCAGRRSSMGSYAGEDDYGDAGAGADDAMDGLMYTEPERMDEEDERRLSTPSIRKHNAPSSEPMPRAPGVFQPRAPSTYPPIATNQPPPPPPPRGLFPPATSHGGSSSSTSPISQSGTMTFPATAHSSTSTFPAPNMTESPKPLSPNALASNHASHGTEAGGIHPHPQHRAHSPGLNQQYHQSHFRAGTTQGTLGLPPPGAPQLPLPPGLSTSDSRFLHSQQTPSLSSKHGATHSHSSSHGAVIHTAVDDASGLSDQSREDKLWVYIRSVQEEVNNLRTEVTALRTQLAAQNQGANSAPQAQPEPGDLGAR
ncbi:hypothetical protein BGW36DRAFT_143531 [Talaromyces proteolyticus]|uniref:C2H2-type domain-containing protein n=1 Tax=Talaromyces proteolyticus TaxID=1131652 RepID=A0AAD4KS91_9EURO|nr:uncharacterized protein BGW36DRAFT_143531 [Talaromyces proteolyticus]KAH8698282.1 hypothetical protein BGW36DRAFT_143531 [Talaromyces proteolyticus]